MTPNPFIERSGESPVRASALDHGRWLREYVEPRFPELAEPFLHALDIWRKSHRSGTLSDDDAHKLLSYARSPRTPLGANAATFLGELCDGNSTARSAVRALVAGRQLHERINALVALSWCQTSQLHEEV